MVCDLSDIFMERTFQHGTFVTDFGLIGFRPVTSFRLWSTDIILSFVEGPLLPKSRFLSVSFSVSVTQSYHLSGGLAYPKVYFGRQLEKASPSRATGQWSSFQDTFRPMPLNLIADIRRGGEIPTIYP